jgi:2,3-bisphosphoglycerate-dependent phosphoglycerate mutase
MCRSPTRAGDKHSSPAACFARTSARLTTSTTRDTAEHQETVEHLLAAYPEEERKFMRVRHHLFLRERDAGWTYDITTAEAEAAFPWLHDYWETVGRFFARPPGGESLAEVAARVYLFLGMLFRDRSQRRILIVSHAGTLRVFRYLLERWTHDEFIERWDSEHIPNCAVTTYAFDATEGRLLLRTLNVVHWQG